jgi:hypothetical protein
MSTLAGSRTPAALAEKFLQQMARRDRGLAARLSEAYQRILVQLEGEQQKIMRWTERATTPQEALLSAAGQARITDLMQQTEAAISVWGRMAQGIMDEERPKVAAAGAAKALEAVANIGHAPGAVLPEQAIAAMIANVEPPSTIMERLARAGVPMDQRFAQAKAIEASGAELANLERYARTLPVRNILEEVGREVAQASAEALVNGVALGRNPRVVAQQLADIGLRPLARALTIARTEQLRAYRASTKAIYQSYPEVVTGWYWYSALDSRCCASCIAQHGTFHPTSESLNSHPNCRCAMVPGVEGLGRVPSGGEWFISQKPPMQRKILGKRGYEAWQRGEVDLDDFVRRTFSPVWGEGSTQASLKYALDQARMAGRGGITGTIVDVSDFSRMVDHEARQDVERAVAKLDKVLNTPERPVPIEWLDLHAGGRTMGSTVVVSRTGGTRPMFAGRIGVSPTPDLFPYDREAVVYHEAMHWYDLMLGRPNGFASETDERFAAWRLAVADSAVVKRLSREAGGWIEGGDVGYAQYAIQLREVWARSVAQFLVERIEGEDGLERFMKMHASQWQYDDWPPVREAVRQTLANLGLLK